jgi:hypothetical protein
MEKHLFMREDRVQRVLHVLLADLPPPVLFAAHVQWTRRRRDSLLSKRDNLLSVRDLV